jgi:hypothetical protein
MDGMDRVRVRGIISECFCGTECLRPLSDIRELQNVISRRHESARRSICVYF